MNRESLVAEAGRTIRAGSKSFHMASRLFDRTTRERAWLLYCWCRHCDDRCDGQLLGHRFEGAAGPVAELELLTRRVLDGDAPDELPFACLAQVLRECDIPQHYLTDHLKGFALDAAGWRPQDEEDLLRYCYYVAGAVGCMMAVVMGVPAQDRDTLERASDLGIAFQLWNIARDVRDDHEAGRCYLPARSMERHGVDPADPLRPDRRDGLAALVGELCSLADRYERSSRPGIERLGFRSRWAIHAAARIYGAIGRRVAALGERAWDERVVVRRRKKVSLLLPALASSAGFRKS